ncbi:methyltransferase domain-containing protein [Sorangium sp. So ce302]|uniref:class I SAM-dependent methyltransferase n=1 Tax=Sorangium sp. So ce302 TaxID=3133297 RepID=UPI003F61D7CC
MTVLGRALFSLHHRLVHVPRVGRVARALAAQVGPAASLLDVGAGDGTVALEVARLVGALRVVGVDVKARPGAALPVIGYDGERLPFPDAAFEAVLLSDVLHHAARPGALLAEALRVASRVVALKDHFRFGPVSERVLLWMDLAGNAAPGVEVRGTYFTPGELVALVRGAGGRITGLEWPLRIHDLPFRLVTQDRLQFAARIERLAGGIAGTAGDAR